MRRFAACMLKDLTRSCRTLNFGVQPADACSLFKLQLCGAWKYDWGFWFKTSAFQGVKMKPLGSEWDRDDLPLVVA